MSISGSKALKFKGEDIVGKRVRVKNVQLINGPVGGQTHSNIVGKCYFYGINNFGMLQCTVDRTPIWPIEETDIEVLE